MPKGYYDLQKKQSASAKGNSQFSSSSFDEILVSVASPLHPAF